jgi:uncharacterized protein YhaN
VDRGSARQGAEQVGFEEAVTLVKQHPGAILIRTKNGSCMVRLADGSVLGVSPPVDRPDIPPEGREKSVAQLEQEIDRLNKTVLIHKNTLDKAHHHLRDKDLEIKQLKAKLEERDRESQILNKVIIVRGKRIEELVSEVKALETKLAKTAEGEPNRMRKADSGATPLGIPDYRLNKIAAATGIEHESKPCSGI